MRSPVFVPYTEEGMSNAELAKILKVTPALASRIRRGIGPISINTLTNLYNYGVDPVTIMQAVAAYRNDDDTEPWVQMFLATFGSPRYSVVQTA